jgi:hypothetical protein
MLIYRNVTNYWMRPTLYERRFLELVIFCLSLLGFALAVLRQLFGALILQFFVNIPPCHHFRRYLIYVRWQRNGISNWRHYTPDSRIYCCRFLGRMLNANRFKEFECLSLTKHDARTISVRVFHYSCFTYRQRVVLSLDVIHTNITVL